MCGFARKAIILSIAFLASGAVLTEARAQIGSSGAGFPRQLTLPPPADETFSDEDLGLAIESDTGAMSVLPDRRYCASDVMVIGRPLAGAEAPKLKTAAFPSLSNMAGCRMSSVDTNPTPVLVAPPHGVKAPVPTYPAVTQLAETSEASRP